MYKTIIKGDVDKTEVIRIDVELPEVKSYIERARRYGYNKYEIIGFLKEGFNATAKEIEDLV